MNEQGWACEAHDKYIKTRELQGEGKWFEALCFECPDGSTYEIWFDQDGDSKVVE